MIKILKIAGITFLTLLLLLILLPILFKGQITEAVRGELNKQLDTHIEFEDVGISLIRNFPNLNFRLYGLTLEGKGDFQGTKLLSADYIGFTFNLSSLWRRNSPMELKRLDIDNPYIHLITFADGRANYHIIPETEDVEDSPEEAGEGVDFALRFYRITDGHVIYDDRGSATLAEIKGFNHSGSGNFADALFEWKSNTKIETASVNYGGISYLRTVPVSWDLDLGVDTEQNVVNILQSDLSLSELKLDLSGLVRFPEDGNLYLDLQMNAPGNEFKELFSVLPIASMADLDGLRAEGSFGLRAEIKGEMDLENEVYPPFNLRAEIDNGMVKYPDMDIPLESIKLDLEVLSPETVLDAMTVDLRSFSFTAAGNPFNGDFFMSTPVSDPNIRANVNGRLDLRDMSRIFPVEGMEQLSGIIDANLIANLAMSQVDAEEWDQIDLSGNIRLRDIIARMEGMPVIEVPSGALTLDQRTTTLGQTRMTIGESDVNLEGNFNNLLVLYSGVVPLKGNLKVNSNLLDIDDMMASFTGGTSEEGVTITDTTAGISPFFNVDIDIIANANSIVYAPYHIRNLSGAVNLKPHTISSSDISLIINDSDLRGSASIQNWYEFAMADERMTVDANVAGGTVDIDKLMPPPTAEADRDEGQVDQPASVPPFKYNIHITARADRVIYKPYELNNLRTKTYLTERDVHIENFQTNLFGDQLEGSGFIGNYMNYVYLDETLTGEIDLRSRGLNLNRWMEAMMSEEQDVPPEEVSTDEFEPVLVPKNLDMAIRADMGNLAYFDMNFRNAKGVLEIREGAIRIEEFAGDIFNGRLGLNGLYDTSDDNPFVSMNLNIDRFNIPSSFQNIATLASVAPLFEYMSGLFSSTLVMAAELGPGMMPVWSTFNAEGVVETIDAYIRNFPPLETAAQRLQFDLFERLELNNTENWFEIVNGTFDLKPVTHRTRDTELKFSGQHRIGGDMDYLINASIPQSILGSGTVGSAVNQGIDFIRSEAGRRGVNLGEGSHVDVAITLKGRLRNPDVGVRLQGVSTSEDLRERGEREVRERIEEERDRARERVEEEVEKVQDRIKKSADAVQDSLRKVAEERERELRERAKKEAEDRLKRLLGDDRTKSDTIKKDTTENIRDRIKNLNPFRRGKSDDG
jgi:hypothetical protein